MTEEPRALERASLESPEPLELTESPEPPESTTPVETEATEPAEGRALLPEPVSPGAPPEDAGEDPVHPTEPPEADAEGSEPEPPSDGSAGTGEDHPQASDPGGDEGAEPEGDAKRDESVAREPAGDPASVPPPGQGPGSVHYYYGPTANRVENLHNLSGSDGSAATEASSLDALLSDLPPRPEILRPFDPSIFRDAEQELSSKALVLLSCFDKRVALAAAYALIEDLFSGHHQKCLRPDLGRTELSIQLFSQAQRSSQTEASGPRAILVEIDQRCELLDALASPNQLMIASALHDLRSRHTTVICATSNRLLRLDEESPRLPESEIYHWHVGYLDHLLRLHFSSEEAGEIQERLLEQRRQARWAEESEDFLREVEGYLERGGEALREQIERCASASTPSEIHAVQARDVFPEEPGVEQWVLYAATYLRDLSPASFEMLVKHLLSDETTEVEEPVEVAGEDGEVEIQTRKVTRTLEEIWSESSGEIFRRCQLVAERRGESSRVIDFAAPHLRGALRRLIETEYPLLASRAFGKLMQGGLVFEPRLPLDLSEQLHRNTVARMVEHPSEFGDSWLLRTVLGLRERIEVAVDPEASDEEQLARLIAAYERVKHWHRLCGRLAAFLQEMLRYPDLEAPVQQFLRQLLQLGDHDAVLRIALELARRLRYARSFDLLYWLRLLIDQRSAETRSEVVTLLHRIAAGSGAEIDTILDTVHGWLPQDDRPPERYAPSSQVALRFIRIYCQATAQYHELPSEGQWPSDYPLFRTLDPADEETRRRLERVLEWIRHPAQGSVAASEEEEALEPLSLIAFLLERWSLILEGTDPEAEVPAGSAALMDLILELAAGLLAPHEQRTIKETLAGRQQAYLDELRTLPVRERDARQLAKNRRRRVMELHRRFAEAVQTTGSSVATSEKKGAKT